MTTRALLVALLLAPLALAQNEDPKAIAAVEKAGVVLARGATDQWGHGGMYLPTRPAPLGPGAKEPVVAAYFGRPTTDATLKNISKQLAGFTDLKELTLDCPAVTDAGLKSLAECQGVHTLNLVGVARGGKGLG